MKILKFVAFGRWRSSHLVFILFIAAIRDCLMKPDIVGHQQNLISQIRDYLAAIQDCFLVQDEIDILLPTFGKYIYIYIFLPVLIDMFLCFTYYTSTYMY